MNWWPDGQSRQCQVGVSITSETNGLEEMTERNASYAWYVELPKIELHIHLEGAIPHEALWQLVQKYGCDHQIQNIEILRSKFEYRDFDHFLDVWVWKNGFLREYEDFEFIAQAVAEDLAKQNIRYAEAFYSPGDYVRIGLDPGKLTEAIRSGLNKCKATEIALIADLIRDHGPERGRMMLDAVYEARDFGVIGVGIGGAESAYPAAAYRDVYCRARELGFRTTAHAGEALGPESVWGVIRSLEVDRIGHATRACEDPRLVDYLAEHRIPLELCPISNLRTGVVKTLAEHPARHFFERGIPISINTDDPKMFGTSLVDEYTALESELGFSREEIEALILNAIESSWLDAGRASELQASFARHMANMNRNTL
jgi:adenosine deaminase